MVVWKGIHFALSQSAKLIFSVIKRHAPLSQRSIVSITGIAERTVRYNLSKLKERELIKEKPNFMDLREKIYTTRGERD